MQTRARSVVTVLTATAIGLAGFAVAGATSSSAQDPAPVTAPATEAVAPSEAIKRISLTIDGFEIASFNRLIGITTEAVAPPRFGEPPAPEPAPPTVVLSRALNASLELAAWQAAVASGDPNARKNCTLTMYDADDEQVAKYFLEEAWPFRLEVTKAGSPTETVTLLVKFIQRVGV